MRLQKGPEVKAAGAEAAREGHRAGGHLFRDARARPFPRPGLRLLSTHASGLLPTDPRLAKPRAARSAPPELAPHAPVRWRESICLMSKSFMSY